MNRFKPLLPEGYFSVQDFILHYHQNNRGEQEIGQTKTNQNLDPEIQKFKRTKVLDDSPETFKKEIVMKNIPVSNATLDSNEKRNYYEREQKSDVHPSTLFKPEQITFKPITKF